MSKKIYNSPDAPAAIGPYSHSAISGGFLFVSGQLPIKDGEMQEEIGTAAKACMDNVKLIVEGAGSKMENIVKCTIYLKDLNDFAAVNEVYGSYFEGDYPARVCLEVAKLPKDAKVEIDAIAAL